MSIVILCVGKVREPYLQEACADLLSKIGARMPVEILEVPDENDGRPGALEQEGARILKSLPKNHTVIALDIAGKSLDTRAFAGLMRDKKAVAFIIGGSNGLSREVMDIAHARVSFSRMTFPHQLMRVLLLDQIQKASRYL
jgi:23S rRNA (pseudouridine1915-N3)-methyltransferase